MRGLVISPASLGGVEILDVMLLMEVVRFEARLEVKLEVRLEGSVGVRGGVLRGELSTVIISGIGLIMLLTAGFRISGQGYSY